MHKHQGQRLVTYQWLHQENLPNLSEPEKHTTCKSWYLKHFPGLRAWCPNIILVLGGWNTSWWTGWSWKLLLTLRAISTTRFILRIVIVPSPSLLILLSLFTEFITLNLLSMSHKRRYVICPSNIALLHSVFTEFDTPYKNLFIWVLEQETMWKESWRVG